MDFERRPRGTQFCLEVEFQGGNTLQNPDCLSWVLHPRQLHHNSISALLLHRWLGDTEGINSVQQGSPIRL